MEAARRVALLLEPGRGGYPLGSDDPGEGAGSALSRHLAEAGHCVDVVVHRPDAGETVVDNLGRRLRIINLAAGASSGGTCALAASRRDALLAFLLAEGTRYDLLHGTSWLWGWVAVDLAARLDAGAVVALSWSCLRETPPNAGTYARLGREVLGRAHRVIVPSLGAQVTLLQQFDIEAERVEVLPPGVDTDAFHPLDREHARADLGISTTDLVAATIVPGGGIPPEVGAATRVAGERIGSSVTLIPVSERSGPAERRLRYGAADVVITTAWQECAETAALEAMACGRPVIGSAIDETSFALGEGVTGSLVLPGEPDDLAERLAHLLTQPGLRAQMGAAARGWVEREYSWTVVARRTVDLYERILLPAEARVDRIRMLALGR